VAITTLDNFCTKYDRRSNPIVRYADDFVIICKSYEEAKKIKKEIAEILQKEIGLTLNDEKKMITNIHQGFNFLGFNIRKYPQNSPHSKYHKVGKLIIKPQPEKVIAHLMKIENILKEKRTAKQESIIRILNPILVGFALFYRFAVSQKTYSWVRNSLWYKLWKWAKRRHQNKPAKWIMKKYFTTNGRKWMFKSEDGQNNIINVEKIPILRYVKVKAQMRVHDGSKEAIEYFRKRERINSLSKIYSVKVEKLFKRQKGMCIYCDIPITEEQIEKGLVHIHHMNPRTQGGDEKLNNLLLCHQECHKEGSLLRKLLNEVNIFHNVKGVNVLLVETER
jgi:RNA-directed DNA polymerase